jgi:hypothetical protein
VGLLPTVHGEQNVSMREVSVISLILLRHYAHKKETGAVLRSLYRFCFPSLFQTELAVPAVKG